MPLLRPRVTTRADVAVVEAQVAPGGPPPPPPPEDSYPAKVVKYIPAEIVAAYQSINGSIAAAAVDPQLKAFISVGWIVFVAVLTPLWLAYATSDRQAGIKPNPVQVWGGLVCFLVWAFALGGAWQALTDPTLPPAVRSLLGSILLAACTLLLPVAERLNE